MLFLRIKYSYKERENGFSQFHHDLTSPSCHFLWLVNLMLHLNSINNFKKVPMLFKNGSKKRNCQKIKNKPIKH